MDYAGLLIQARWARGSSWWGVVERGRGWAIDMTIDGQHHPGLFTTKREAIDAADEWQFAAIERHRGMGA